MYPLARGQFAPRNQWYVAAWSSEITRTPMERWVLDEPVAFYRTREGQPVALAGRCPHRHFPLGKSRVIDDNIECGYHGITFSPTGACVRVPSQKAIPSSCRVKSYPLIERWQWVWIWMGDPDEADEALLPDHDAIGITDPNFKVDGGSYHAVPGRYMLMHDNLFDLTHFSYLHKTSIASGDIAASAEIRRSGPNWISGHFEFKDVECPPFHQHMLDYEGRVDRIFGMTLHMPCLHEGYDELFRPGMDRSHPDAVLGRFKVYHAITPATRHTAHYFFAIGRTFRRDDAAFGRSLLDGLERVIAEDLVATREIEQMLQGLSDEPHDLLLRADVTCVKGRRMFEAMIRKEQAGPCPRPAVG